MEPTTVTSLRRVRSLACAALESLRAGDAVNGASALVKIRDEAEDGVRYATEEADAVPVSGDAAELRATLLEASEIADGEAVEAYCVLHDAVARYLGEPESPRVAA